MASHASDNAGSSKLVLSRRFASTHGMSAASNGKLRPKSITVDVPPFHPCPGIGARLVSTTAVVLHRDKIFVITDLPNARLEKLFAVICPVNAPRVPRTRKRSRKGACRQNSLKQESGQNAR